MDGGPPFLRVDVALCRRSGFRLEAAFETAGRTMVLFGPSGCGKSTLIHIVAGFLRPDRGRVAVAGRTVFDSARGVSLPPALRGFGCVFQEGLLFPHMTARGNLTYGLPRRMAADGADGAPSLDDVVDLLDLGRVLERRPAQLSGGERQRVAIGRALLRRPGMLLMDEPLAALDRGRKMEILPFLERLRDAGGPPMLYVTHSLDEALRLGDSMALMEGGRVRAVGPVESVAAGLPGVDADSLGISGAILSATVAAHDPAWGLTKLRLRAARGAPAHLALPLLDQPVGVSVRVLVRAQDVALATRRPRDISIRNVLPGAVTLTRAVNAAELDVFVDVGGPFLRARITRQAAAAMELRPGAAVFALIKAARLDPRYTGRVDSGCADSGRAEWGE